MLTRCSAGVVLGANQRHAGKFEPAPIALIQDRRGVQKP